jgi:hypothetical protein
MLFVYIHLAFFGFWIVANLGWIPGVPQWDEILRGARHVGLGRGDLPLDLRAHQPEPHAGRGRQARRPRPPDQPLAEHEITKLATLVAAVAERMGVRVEGDEELAEIQQNVAPEAVLDEIEATDGQR